MKKTYLFGLITFIALCSCSTITDTEINSTSSSSNPVSSTSNQSSSSSSTSTSEPEEKITNELPIFYGASKLKISNDLVTTFDPYDSRWRVYVRDYEDGDLTHKINMISNNVTPTVVGDYEVKYSITDSDNNLVNFKLDVQVTSETSQTVVVERIVYAIPAMKNMSDTGMERCNAGDSQNLGIYLPSGTSAKIEYISDDTLPSKFKITNCTNTRDHNNIYTSDTSIDIKSLRDNVSYDCIPLITSPRLTDETIDKTYSFRLTYKNDVKPLTYYHYGDNEVNFFSTWNSNQHSFSLIDGEAFQMVVPLEDKDKLVGESFDFKSLDEVLSYYLKVVNRYDKMAGLSFETKDELDKNYRTKYLGLADGHWVGSSIGAFYEASYIGIGSYSAIGFFRYGWGSLHEFGHGYQGSFGRGVSGGFSMNLGETGNNVLAHYIQLDKTVYKANGDWLGDMKTIEEEKNADRITGVNIFEGGGYTYASTRLYFLINLFDAFGGEEVYGKLFSYYRHFIKDNGTNYTIPDIYASFFFEKYNANILPYLNAWKLDVSNSIKLKITNSNSKNYIIPFDVLSSSELSTYKENYPNNLLYAPTSEEKLDMNNVKYDLNINIDIDDISKLNGKYIGIKKNGNFITKVKIEDSKTLTIKNLERGFYQVIFPAIDLYDLNEAKAIYLSDENNSISNTYTKIETSFDHQATLKILGRANKTLGFSMAFSDKYTKANLTFGASNLGNQNNWWTGERADLTCASVIVKDEEGNELYNWTVKGRGYFQDLENQVSSIDLKYGYTIEVYDYFGEDKGLVNIYSNSASDTTLISDYDIKSKTKTFKVTEYGLSLLEVESFNVKQVMYNKIKNDWINNINTLVASLTEESLKNRNIDISIKNTILKYYSYLEDEDKPENIQETLTKIQKGGSPTITLVKGDNITLSLNENIDLYSLITIYDNEDYDIESNSSNVTLTSSLDTSKKGTYQVTYQVKDSDNNVSTKSITIQVK